MNLYPINLNIRDRLCVVVGGGKVALRKVKSLLGCRAKVRLVSPELCVELQRLAEEDLVEWRRKGYETGDLEGAFIAFAATDRREVQELVVRDGGSTSTMINVADSPRDSDFHIPASHRQGRLLLTVSTGGGSPALAARLRRRCAAHYGVEYDLLIGLMADVRKKVLAGQTSGEQNQKLFESLLDSGLELFIAGRDWHSLESTLRKLLPADIEAGELVRRLRGRLSD
ncbi:MAG: bifunctional precorrin-2 dehydrogenase/sirohydrochlorin ferrochelatase [Thermodesulfobacteriota bacterium]